jgi:RNA 3'-terminal phosphate cyclase (ATP)
MLTVDGSQGEGGQILRTSLALSLVSGTPFRIERIRAGRAKPGLMRQHLTALEAAAAVGDADVDGAGIGAHEIVFRPKHVRPGDYRFAVGTAGSAGLVLQTVLLLLLTAAGASRLALQGGTHNPHAPPFGFLAGAFLPLLRRMGGGVEARLDRPGFYPAGGGQMTVDIAEATTLHSLELAARGATRRRRARALVARLWVLTWPTSSSSRSHWPAAARSRRCPCHDTHAPTSMSSSSSSARRSTSRASDTAVEVTIRP